MEYNQENINKLARLVVDNWDMDTLVDYAIQALENEYNTNKNLFEADVENNAGEL